MHNYLGKSRKIVKAYIPKRNESQIDKDVQVCGWVNKIRDHGGVIFIDLRDIKGLVQIVVNPDDKNLFKIAESVRSEFMSLALKS